MFVHIFALYVGVGVAKRVPTCVAKTCAERPVFPRVVGELGEQVQEFRLKGP